MLGSLQRNNGIRVRKKVNLQNNNKSGGNIKPKPCSAIFTSILLCLVIFNFAAPSFGEISSKNMEDLVKAKNDYESILDDLIANMNHSKLSDEVSELCIEYKKLEERTSKFFAAIKDTVPVVTPPDPVVTTAGSTTVPGQEPDPVIEPGPGLVNIPPTAEPFFSIIYNDLRGGPTANPSDIYDVFERYLIQKYRDNSPIFGQFKNPNELILEPIGFQKTRARIILCPKQGGVKKEWYLTALSGYLNIVRGDYTPFSPDITIYSMAYNSDQDILSLPSDYTFCTDTEEEDRKKFDNFMKQSKQMWKNLQKVVNEVRQDTLTGESNYSDEVMPEQKSSALVEKPVQVTTVSIDKTENTLDKILENFTDLREKVCAGLEIEQKDKPVEILLTSLLRTQETIVSLLQGVEFNYTIEKKCESEIKCKRQVIASVVEGFRNDFNNILFVVWGKGNDKLASSITFGLTYENIKKKISDNQQNVTIMTAEYNLKPNRTFALLNVGYNQEKLKENGLINVVENNDGTQRIEDRLHGLVWMHFPYTAGGFSLDSAREKVQGTWRLPSVEEMETLAATGFDFYPHRPYWTSEKGAKNIAFCFARSGDCANAGSDNKLAVYAEEELPLILVSDLKED